MSLSDAERRFASSHRVARLATADEGGAPHVIPICFAVSRGCFYFVVDEKPKRTRTGLKRLRNIAVNPRVALLIDDYSDDWSRLAYLLIHGRATAVAERTEFARVLAILRRRYPPYRDMPLAFDSHPMIRIEVERTHLWP